MKIIFHGAAQEVGKSCIEIQSKGKKYILDAGIKFTQFGNEYPKCLDKIYQLDGVFLSHAHLDHSGALPMLEHKRLNCPIYTTKVTWDTTNLLLEDSYHLEKLKHLHPAYVERDIRKVKKDLRFVHYDKQYETHDGKIKFNYLNSGHIPGGASILMEIEGKKLLYTADVNTEKTLLMEESKIDQLQDIDILISENTYGDRMHPPRNECEEGLLDSVKTCLHNGGTALIPVFSVGRSQEILVLLDRLQEDVPIYLDGMARKLTEMYINSDDPYIKNKDILERMYQKCHIIKHPKEREKIAKQKQAIIVTTSGMIQGGPVLSYIEDILKDEKNYIILTGYQAKGTKGRHVFEDHIYYNKGQRFNVKAKIRKYDFSAHYGQDCIRNLQKKLNPKVLILQHGDMGALCESRAFAKENLLDTVTILPAIGQPIEITQDKVRVSPAPPIDGEEQTIADCVKEETTQEQETKQEE